MGKWSKENKEIVDGGRYSIKQDCSSCSLTVHKAMLGDSGDYVCTVANNVGQTACTLHATVAGSYFIVSGSYFTLSISYFTVLGGYFTVMGSYIAASIF